MGSVGSVGVRTQASGLDIFNQLNIDTEYDSRVTYWENQIQKGNNRPILVDADNFSRIIDGNHTAQAYKNLGIVPDIYAMNSVEFLNGASESSDTVEFIRDSIQKGRAYKIG